MHKFDSGLCQQCGKLTANPKFCSKSCAASFNNRRAPKRKRKERFCKHCNIPITSGRTVCDSCNRSFVDWSVVTLMELQIRAGYQVNARVRGIARKLYCRSGLPKRCRACGYDKHFEVAHIRAISDFPPETAIAEINSLSNLVALCRNCHWELHHGHILL